MKNITIYSLLFLLLLSFGSCKKDIDMITQTDLGIPAVIEFKGSLVGTVTDIRGNELPNVLVNINGQTTLTNEDGVYILNDVWLNQNGTVVSFTKSEFFEATKIFNASTKNSNIVNVVLADRQAIIPISANQESEIPVFGANSTETKARVTFQANSFLTSNGEVFQGDVMTFSVYMDPTTEVGFQLMPGDLRATDSENIVRSLSSFGMVRVELENVVGQKLHLDPNKPATIYMELPENSKETAPSTIPLWHFKTSNGYWQEEGSAELIDGVYVGQVNHFSTWNCDIPYPKVDITGRVLFSNGSPASNLVVTLASLDINFNVSASIDTDGFFGGPIPANQNFKLQLRHPICDEIIYEQDFSTENENIDLGTFSIDASEKFNFLTVSLVDCDSNPLPSAYLKLSNNFRAGLYFPNSAGLVTVALSSCYTSFNIWGIDFKRQLISDINEYPNGLDQDTNHGNLIICDPSDTWIDITFQGTNYYSNGCFISVSKGDFEDYSYRFNSMFGTVIDGDTVIVGNPDWRIQFNAINVAGLLELDVPLQCQYALMTTVNSGLQHLEYGCEDPCENFTFTLDKIPDNIIGFYEGSLEGEVIRNTGEVQTISGTFRAFNN